MTNRWLLVLLGIVVVAGLGYWSHQTGLWSNELLPAMAETRPQTVFSPDEAQLPALAARQVRAEANVAPVRSVELGMPVEGIVQEVLIQEGDLEACARRCKVFRGRRR